MNIILGGTHGLGKEIARELQGRGEETFVVGRSYDEAEHGAGMAVDLADKESVAKLTEYIKGLGDTALKGFWWVSGYGWQGDFAAQPDVQRMGDVNFSGVLPVAQVAWIKMLGQEAGGHFVVVGSTSSFRARANEAVYAATKHALKGFTESLGKESERLQSSVKVAFFMPGGMQTPFWDGMEQASYHDFLNPAKVGERIVGGVSEQQDYFYEETIERGSL